MVHTNSYQIILLSLIFMQVAQSGWKIDEIKRKIGQIFTNKKEEKPGPIVNGCNLCVWRTCTPAIKGASTIVFNPQLDARNLDYSLRGIRNYNTDLVISIITSRSEQQRQEISEAFKSKTALNLAVFIKDNFPHQSWRSGLLLSTLAMPIHEFYATEFHRMIGLMANKNVEGRITLIELFTTLPPCLIRKIGQFYEGINKKGKLGTNIEMALKTQFSQNDYIDVLLIMAKGTRDDDFRISWFRAWRDASRMKEVIVKDSWKLKNTVFRDIFTQRSISQLGETIRLYEKIREKDDGYESLEVDIKNKMESVKEIYITMVKIIKNKSTYFAVVLDNILDNLKDLDNIRFISLIRGRSDIDLEDIKLAYTKKYGNQLIKTFADREKKTSGKFYDTLVNII